MFYQIFLSPQVKRWAIITYKHAIYELPHKLPKDLRLIIYFILLFLKTRKRFLQDIFENNKQSIYTLKNNNDS